MYNKRSYSLRLIQVIFLNSLTLQMNLPGTYESAV